MEPYPARFPHCAADVSPGLFCDIGSISRSLVQVLGRVWEVEGLEHLVLVQ